MKKALERWANTLRNHVFALYLALQDHRVSFLTKSLIGVVVAYALSPIDLIPDFIPVIGYLDDFLLLPAGIWLAIKLMPEDVWLECQILAQKKALGLPKSFRAAVIIVSIWTIVALCVALWIGPLLVEAWSAP